MKKLGVLFISFILLFSIIGFAYADNEDKNGTGSNDDNQEGINDSEEVELNSSLEIDSQDQDREMERNEMQIEDNQSEFENQTHYQFIGEDGKKYEIETRTKVKMKNGEVQENEHEFNFNGYTISSKFKISVENKGNESRLRVDLSNGMEKEIKVLPNVASQTAIDVFENKNITVVLKEVGEGANSSVVYEAESDKLVKILGLFKVTAKLKAVINSENGEIKNFEKPWWYSLASNVQEEI